MRNTGMPLFVIGILLISGGFFVNIFWPDAIILVCPGILAILFGVWQVMARSITPK